MAIPEPRYKLDIRFEVQKVLVDPEHPEREQYTNERITLNTNMDLQTGHALSEVLRLVEQIEGIAKATTGAAP